MKEQRATSLKEFRAIESDGGEMILEGYAAVFDQPTTLFRDESGNEYKEVISRAAFDAANMSKCCLKYNHESSVPVLARTRGGSLELNVDDYGLHFRAKLFNTSVARDVYELVKAGGIEECSFAFTIAADGDSYDKATRTRSINAIDTLWDCAVVDNPAYGGTSVSARSYLEAEAEKEHAEWLESQKRAEQIARINNMIEEV